MERGQKKAPIAATTGADIRNQSRRKTDMDHLSTAVATIDPRQFITAANDELRTTSLKVAEAFGKRHDNVIQKIQSLDCSEEWVYGFDGW